MSDRTSFGNDASGNTHGPRIAAINASRIKDPCASTDSRDLLTYWNATRRDLDVPRRSDIDPRGIAGMLSRTFVLEQIAPGLARFRVAGTHLGDLLGMDVRGMPISAMLRPGSRERLALALRDVFDMPGILRASLVSPGELRRPELLGELLILPLRDERGDVTRAIGCLVSRGQIGRAPRRFDVRHIRVDPVSVVKAAAPLSETGSNIATDAAPEFGKSDDGAITARAPDAPKFAPLRPGQPSYLRVVVTE